MRGLARSILLLALVPSNVWAAAPYDWPQFNGDARHSGDNTRETSLSSANVGQLRQLFQVPLPEVADSTPVLLTSMSTGSGVRDLLFVNTKQGRLLALDAHSGATVWTVLHANTGCSGANCVTTSAPAIDPARNYVYAYGLDGKVHKHDVATGTESTTGGWPELATAKPDVEKSSSALAVATARSGTSYLYVTHSGYPGDAGDYQGHLTAINLATGAQNVFNAACSTQVVHLVEGGSPDCPSRQSGIWARAGVIYDADIDKIFVVTGNGDFIPSSNDWGDSVVELNPDGTSAAGRPADSYTPASFQALQNQDLDLGSTAPVVLPTPAGFPYPHVGLQSGKDGIVRLLNLDNLSNQGTGPQPGRTGGELATLQLSRVMTAAATWINPADSSTWVFVAATSSLAAYQLGANGSSVTLTSKWSKSTGATSPIVANNVLYVAASSGIQALSPATGAQLWQGSSGASLHWESPVVANGILYILDENAHLTAFTAPAAPSVPATTRGALALAAAALLALGLLAARARRPRPSH
jgi:PQQ-like domain